MIKSLNPSYPIINDGDSPETIIVNGYSIMVPPPPSSGGVTSSPFPATLTPCQTTYLAMISPVNNSHTWLKNQFYGLYPLFMKGDYTPLSSNVPAPGQMLLFKTLTVCYQWQAVVTHINTSNLDQTANYNNVTGVSTTDTTTTTFGIDIGVTGTIGQIGVSLSASFSKEESHSFTTSSETSYESSAIIPPKTSSQVWQLTQTFNVSAFQIAVNPANGLVLPAWQSTTITSSPQSLSQGLDIYLTTNGPV